MNTLRAFFVRDAQVALSYRIPFFFDAVALLAGAATFHAIGTSIGQQDSFFVFAIAGLMVLRVGASLARIAHSIEGELAAGTLEFLLSSPLRPAAVILSGAAFELLRGVLLALLFVPVAVLVFGADLALDAGETYAALLIGLLGAALLFAAVAAATVATVLLIRQGTALANAVGLTLPVLAGAYFPLSALPQPLELLAEILPFRLAVDILRTGLTDGQFEAGTAVALIAGGAAALAGTVLVLHLAIERSRRLGTLAQT